MAAHGGKRQNAGRPKGKPNAKTLERTIIQEAFNQRVMAHADSLFHAQFGLAVGSVQVYRVDEEKDGNKTKRVHTLIKDPKEIKAVLDENEGSSGVVGEDFYIVSPVMPDNRAIDSLLNRSLGKPKDSLDVTSNGETVTFSLTPTPHSGT